MSTSYELKEELSTAQSGMGTREVITRAKSFHSVGICFILKAADDDDGSALQACAYLLKIIYAHISVGVQKRTPDPHQHPPFWYLLLAQIVSDEPFVCLFGGLPELGGYHLVDQRGVFASLIQSQK